MKKLVLLFVFGLVVLHIYSQDVPVINTTIAKNMNYTDKELPGWQRFSDLYDKTEGDQGLLSPEDRVFYEKWISKLGDDIDSGMPWMINGPGCSWYCGAMYEIQVSSSLESMGNNNYSKDNLWDDDARTAWVEGVKGYGIGEYIEFIFPYYAARATSCSIANGYNKNEKTWNNNSRVKTLNIYEDDKLIAIVNLKDTRNLQSFELPHPIPNRRDDESRPSFGEENEKQISLKFVIIEAYKGDKYDDTAISELIFDGIDVHCLAKGTRITMSDLTRKDIEDIKIGDMVLSYNLNSKSFESKKVICLNKVNHDNLLRLKFKEREIIATNDHPFLSSDGWKSFEPKKTKNYKRYYSVSVNKYKVGDLLYFHDAGKQVQEKIEAINTVSDTMETYTLELDGDGAFIANGLIVGQE